ncbi:MAG: permease [Gaiellaceae bacterium]|nr:permease [Gaiellaceae bacterium]
MKVPRSEAEAYRLLLLTIGYFALIVAASWINRWLGLAVFVVLTLAVLWRSFGRRDEPPPTRHVEHRSEEGEQRILVLANETVQGGALREAIAQKSAGRRAHVLVVTPALNSPLRHWASDEDGARANAELRQAASLRALERLGVEARGEIGDADPLQALDDACRSFGPDEIVISTHPEGRSHWLESNVVERARARFDVPITHVVVDLAAETEQVRDPD